METISCDFRGGTEENHQKISVRVAGVYSEFISHPALGRSTALCVMNLYYYHQLHSFTPYREDVSTFSSVVVVFSVHL